MWEFFIFYSKEAFFAAIHLFISSHDEIKDFCSTDKLMRRNVMRRYLDEIF